MNFRHKLLIPLANLIIGLSGFYVAMYQISLRSISETFSLSSFMMGVIVALQAVGTCVPPLFLGSLSERIGKRGVIMISMPLMVLGTFIVFATHSLEFFIIGIMLCGAGFSTTEGTLSATLCTEFSKSSKFHMGITQASFSIGAVISPILCEAMVAAGYSYNTMFGIISAAYLGLFVIYFFTKQNNDIKGYSDAGIRTAVSFFLKRAFILVVIAMIMYVGAEVSMASFTDSYLALTLLKPGISALALSLFWAGMIPTRLLLGAIKLDHRTSIISCAAGVLASIVAILIIPGDTARLAAFFSLGAFCGPCWPLIMDMVMKEHPKNAGTVSNIMISVGGFGGAVIPIIAGAFIFGTDFTPVFIIPAVCIAAMAAMLFFSGRQTNNNT